MKKLNTMALFLFLWSMFTLQVAGQDHPALKITANQEVIQQKATRDFSLLYSQMDNPSDVGTNSQMYPDFPTFSCQGADDFFVPGGEIWQINLIEVTGFYSLGGGPALKANVFVYQNNPTTNSPGEEMYAYYQYLVEALPDGSLLLIFPVPLVIPEGHYWLSVQPVMDYTTFGQWFWRRQSAPTILEEFHWQNPGGGFGQPNALTWQKASLIDFGTTSVDYNLSFALSGTIVEEPGEMSFDLIIGKYLNPEPWNNWVGGIGEVTKVTLIPTGVGLTPMTNIEGVNFSYSSDGLVYVDFYFDTEGSNIVLNSIGPDYGAGDGWSGYLPHEMLPQINFELFIKATVSLLDGSMHEVTKSIFYDPTPPSAATINIYDWLAVEDETILINILPELAADLAEVQIAVEDKPEEFLKGVGDYSQFDDDGCASASAAACLKWFADSLGDDQIMGGLTLDQLYDQLYEDFQTSQRVLEDGSNMFGAHYEDVVSGLRNWIAQHGNGYRVNLQNPFNWQEMRNQLERRQDVLTTFYYNTDNGQAGHQVTFNSIKNRPEENGTIRVDFMDPWGDGEIQHGYLNPETGQITGYTGELFNEGTIAGNIIICPVEEGINLPESQAVSSGPDFPPVLINLGEPGLKWVRLRFIDFSGHAWQEDIILERILPTPLPVDGYLRIGDWSIAENWHNWIGGQDGTTQLQLHGFSEFPVAKVSFLVQIGDEWVVFDEDEDGYELIENTTGTGSGEGDGWSGYFPHNFVPQINADLMFRADVILEDNSTFEVMNSITYDPTPPDDVQLNIEDFMILQDNFLLLDIEPGSANIQEVNIEVVTKPEEFNKGIPGITQPTGVTCAPTAAAACLKWFESQGDTQITAGLTNAALIDSLKKYCKTSATGTLPENLANGLKKWIEGHGNGYTIRGPLPFDWKEMRNELERGQDVLSGIAWTGGGGHRMTFNSIKNRPEPDGKIRVDFMDPWTGQQEWGYLDPATGELTGFTSTAGNSGKLKGIIIICPKETAPLPASGYTVTGPNPPPVTIPVDDPGLYFLRINILDQDGHTSRFDLVVDRVVPVEPFDGFISIGDFVNPEPWNNWIGGVDATSTVQLFQTSGEVSIDKVEFSFRNEDLTWSEFYIDLDGSQTSLNTHGPLYPEGDGWSGYLPHALLPQTDHEVFIKAAVTLTDGTTHEFIHSTFYNPTPPDGVEINLTDWLIIDDETLLLEINPGTCTDIQQIEVEVVEKPEEFNKGIPDVWQFPYDYGCAPASAAACLKWFESQGDDQIAGELTSDQLLDSLYKYMHTDQRVNEEGDTIRGTLPADVVSGLREWIEKHGNGYRVTPVQPYDWKQMRDELEKGQDVLTGVLHSTGGHMMTFNSIKNRPEPDGRIRVDFMDPWSGEEEYGYLNPETGVISDFSNPDTFESATIFLNVIVCPNETTSSMPSPDVVIPGPVPAPTPIDVGDPGLKWIRIRVIDQSGHVWQEDLVVERTEPINPFADVIVKIGDYIGSEDWYNWFGGPDTTTPVQLLDLPGVGDACYDIQLVNFSWSADGIEWQLFDSDDDGSEPYENTFGSFPSEGDGWTGYIEHANLPQSYQEILFKAEIVTDMCGSFEVGGSKNFDPTPPSGVIINVEDFVMIENNEIVLEVNPGLCSNLTGIQYNITKKPEYYNKGIPHVGQREGDHPNGGNAYCAPTAAAACLKYFNDPFATGFIDSIHVLIDSLARICRTDSIRGTAPSNLAGGMLEWILRYGFHYSVRGPLAFNWHQMRSELLRSQNVLSGIYWPNGDGHRMTMNSIKLRPEKDGKVRVDFMDPWTGKEEWGYLNTTTGQLTGFTGAGASGRLGNIIIVCPREPEPVLPDYPYLPGSGGVLTTISVPDPGLYTLEVRAINESGSIYTHYYILENPVRQEVALNAGWSGLSSYVVPSDDNFEAIFGSAIDDLIIMYNNDGMLWPAENINTLGFWNADEGYVIKMAADATVTFTGQPNPLTTVTLTEGLNILHVPTECGMLTWEVFEQLNENFLYIQGIALPQIFIPMYGIDNLNILEPGKAYFIVTTQDVTLTFPECGVSRGDEKGQIIFEEEESPWGVTIKSPVSHNIVVTSHATGFLNPGDFIGVFNPAGQLAGYVLVGESHSSVNVTVFGKDPFNSVASGMNEGEKFEFRYYDNASRLTRTLEPVYDASLPAAGTFQPFGLSVVIGFKTSSLSVTIPDVSEITLYPNPNDGTFTIIQNNDQPFIRFEVIDPTGQSVSEGALQAQTTINLKKRTGGIYFIRLSGPGTVLLKKIVIQR
ncbi:MAG: T9SS type A sorting domain-containing protein [Bacteroidales bacterium]|nr:T9SS type A sorting domain-containing protein [Bacteroidales bacterium]